MSTDEHPPLGRRIFLTSQVLKNFVERMLGPFGLTGEQFHLLKSMDPSIGQQQNELCKLVDKSPANLTRILDRLEKKKLIERRDNPNDRRASLVFRTDEGAALVARVSTLFESLSKQVEAGISPEERTIFHNILNRIDQNLKKLSEEDGD